MGGVDCACCRTVQAGVSARTIAAKHLASIFGVCCVLNAQVGIAAVACVAVIGVVIRTGIVGIVWFFATLWSRLASGD